MGLGIQKNNFLPLCHVRSKIPPSAWPFIGPRRRGQLAVIVGASCPVQFPRHYSRNSYDKLYRVLGPPPSLGCAKLPSPLPRGRKNQSSTFLCLHHNTKAIEMFASVMNLKFFIFLDFYDFLIVQAFKGLPTLVCIFTQFFFFTNMYNLWPDSANYCSSDLYESGAITLMLNWGPLEAFTKLHICCEYDPIR